VGRSPLRSRHSLFDGAEPCSLPSLVKRPNPPGAYAAPAANGRIQRVAYDTKSSPYVALQAAKLAIAANKDHDLIKEAEERARVLNKVMEETKKLIPEIKAREEAVVQAAKLAQEHNPAHQLEISEVLTRVQQGTQAGNLFAGSYRGSFSGTGSVFGYPPESISGSVSFTVDQNGVITVTNPGHGSGTIMPSGFATIGGAGGSGSFRGATYKFNGVFVRSPSGGVSVQNGGWSATFNGGSGRGISNATRS